MPPLLPIFVAATLAWETFSLVLLGRQVRHVRRHRDAVPADFTATVTIDAHRKAADYTVARARVAALGGLIDTGLTIFWIAAGLNLLSGALDRLMQPSLAREVTLLAIVLAVPALVTLPLKLWSALVLERRFGFRRASAGLVALDLLKGAALATVIGLPLLTALMALLRSAGGLWWLWTWCGAVVLILAAPALYTRVIAPLFNRFEPIADEALVRRLELLLERCGFRANGLLTMDASRRSSHANAFFIGFGRAKRIVLFDTLLARQSPDEIEAVVAHELGHFRHRHVLTGTLRAIVTIFVVLFVYGVLCRQTWLLDGFGLHDHGEATRFIAASLLLGLLGPAMAPFSNWVSRRHEFQADEFARREVGAEPLISALTKLTSDGASTLTPDPLYALVHYSHPPVPIRVAHLRA
jgi:STE24 endopeptidase